MNESDQELFESLASMVETMVFITDMESNSLWVNDTLVQETGYTLEDYRFQRFENPFIPAEDIAVVGEFLTEFLASDARVSGIVRNRFVDRWGATMHVRSRVTKIEWEGKPALLYNTVREEERDVRAVDAEDRYRSLVEAATDSIVRLRPDLTFHFSNRCFQDLVGRSPVELNTVRFPELVAESHRDAVQAQLTGTAPRFQITAPVLGTGGRRIWLEGTFVRIARGADAGLLQAILRDTTEKRLLDARVQRAQKEETLGQMAGGIAHDLNNILTAIVGSASLVELRLASGEVIDDALGDIRVAAERAAELASSMLAYAGEGNAERLPVDVRRLVGEMKPLLASGLPKNVELRVEASADPMLVSADEIQLRQVVMNLIVNAADASMPDGGEVVVEAAMREPPRESERGMFMLGSLPSTGRFAVIRVTDRGAGMSQEVQERIFEPFYSTKGKGRGLGLAAVLGILGRHDGCLGVTSVEGEGTEMEVWLPLTDAAPRPEATRAPPKLTQGEGVVLVVDDEALLRRLVRRALEPLGFSVVEAANGEDAVAYVDGPDAEVAAVILDQTMPGMGGDRALVEIRQRCPDVPVLRTSGYAADPSGASLDAHTHFLSKPYTVDALIDMLERAITAGRRSED